MIYKLFCENKYIAMIRRVTFSPRAAVKVTKETKDLFHMRPGKTVQSVGGVIRDDGELFFVTDVNGTSVESDTNAVPTIDVMEVMSFASRDMYRNTYERRLVNVIAEIEIGAAESSFAMKLHQMPIKNGKVKDGTYAFMPPEKEDLLSDAPSSFLHTRVSERFEYDVLAAQRLQVCLTDAIVPHTEERFIKSAAGLRDSIAAYAEIRRAEEKMLSEIRRLNSAISAYDVGGKL